MSFFSKQEENSYLVQDNKEWMLILVNEKNPLPDGYSPKLKKIRKWTGI